MYIKGAARRSVGFWAKHLQNTVDNIRAEIIEKRGLAADDLAEMMREMQQDARLTRCSNFMYIASFNPCPHEQLTEQQWERAYEIFEEERGIPAGQARIVIEHEKEGRTHRHVVWNRIDLENMRAFPDGRNDKVCDAAKQEIEKELGLTRTPGLKEREEGTSPPPKAYEMYRGMKSGLDPRDITAEVTEIFRNSENGADFVAGLQQHGYQFVQGRHAFCILDPAGHEHSLARRLEGMNTKELRAFMQGVDLRGIPTVDQAKAAFRERHLADRQADLETVRREIEWEEALAKAAIEKEKVERKFVEPQLEKEAGAGGVEQQHQRAFNQTAAPELGKTQGEIRLARTLSSGPQGFANAIEDRGFILARITPEDISADMEKLLEEWEERRRNPQTWMEHEGGFAALKPELQDSARRSFEAWNKERGNNRGEDKTTGGGTRKEYTVEDYVDYVQKKWLECPKSQLDRAAGGLAVVTPFGSVHTLTPRNTGLDRDELPHYLNSIDRRALLSISDAQVVMRDVREHRRQEWRAHRREEWLAQQPLGKTAGEIRLAYSLTRTGQEFAEAIEDRGSVLARITDKDAERLNRWEKQRLQEEWKAPDKKGKVRPDESEKEAGQKYRVGELVVVNQSGQIFQLTRQTTGVDENARAERLKDIDHAALFSVTAAQSVMRELRQHGRQEREQAWQRQREEWLRPAREAHWPAMPQQPERKAPGLFQQAATEAVRDERTENLRGAAAQAWTAFRQSGNEKAFTDILEDNHVFSVRTGDRKAFAAALEDRGIAFAVVTKEEAEKSHGKEAAFVRAVGNYAPRYKEGEIVLVTEPRPEYRREGELTEPRRVHKLDQSLAEKFVKTLGNRAELRGIEATIKASDERAQRRATERETSRLDRATDIKKRTEIAAADLTVGIHKSAKVAGSALDGLGKGFEALSNAFDSLIAPILTPAQIYQGEKARLTREAEAESSIDFSRYTADRAQERQNSQEQQAARDRQRDIERER